MNLPKLSKDFGVRALLATIALVFFEAIMITVLILLYKSQVLDIESSLSIAGLAQAPAMLALGFYFGTRTAQPPSP